MDHPAESSSGLGDDLDRAIKAYRAARAHRDKVTQQLQAARRSAQDARKALGAAIVRAYLAGARIKELAARTGLSPETIRVELRGAGVAPD